jgi:hypothetical protein
MLLAARGEHVSSLKIAQQARVLARQMDSAKPPTAQPLDDFLSTLQKHVSKKQTQAKGDLIPTTALFGGGAAKTTAPAPAPRSETAQVAQLLGAPTPTRDPRLAPATSPASWAVDARPNDVLLGRVDEVSVRQGKDHVFFSESYHQLRRRTEELERRVEQLAECQPLRSAPRDAIMGFNNELLNFKGRLSTLEGSLRKEINACRFSCDKRQGAAEAELESVRRRMNQNEKFVAEAKEKVRVQTSQLESERRERGRQIEAEVKRQLQDSFMEQAAKLLADEVEKRLKVTPAPAPAPKKRQRAAASVDDLLPSEDEEDGELR